jgi:hypothetical protein
MMMTADDEKLSLLPLLSVLKFPSGFKSNATAALPPHFPHPEKKSRESEKVREYFNNVKVL